MSKTYYKVSNSTLDSEVTLPSFEVNVLKGDNKIMMIKTTDSESSLKIPCLKPCVFVTYLTKMI